MSGPWNIPDSWAWVTAGEIADIVGGGTPPTGDSQNFVDGTIAWITPADLSGYSEKFISRGERNITEAGLNNSGARTMPAGTVLFSSRAPIGYVAIAANPVATNQGFKSFILPDGIDSSFAYWFLKRAKQLAVDLASGTTFQEISGKKAAEIPFVIAPAREQKRIVAVVEALLTDLDAAVAGLKRVQANLKRYRASVLKAACEGRLVPAEAELARKECRSYESGEQLLQRILKERRAKWEADQLAKMHAAGKPPKDDNWKQKYKEPSAPETAGLLELPEGWTPINLGQVTWSVKDGPHYSPKYADSGVPFITGGQVRPSGVDFSAAKYISPELHSQLIARCRPEKNDVLYTKGGTTGIARVNTYDEEFSVWVHVAVLKLVDSADPFFIQHALNSPSCYRQSQRYTHGVGNQDLGLTRMVWITFGLPPIAEQKRIVEEVDLRLSVVDEIEGGVEAQLKRSSRLRQAILKRAFEGKLVPQDPNDEPASVLLERIRAERNAGTQKGTSGKSKRALAAKAGLQ